MTHQPFEPTFRHLRLGTTLRTLRTQAGMTLEGAATAVGWQTPKLSKIENARQQVRPAEVTALLGVYGVTDPDAVTALENLARDARRRGWWQNYRAVVSRAYTDYISLEDEAERICEWSPLLVPGLLQTAAYARETIGAAASSTPPNEVAALAEVRQARQAVLSRPDRPLQFWAIVHEAALHHRFAIRPTVMREQLQRILDAAELPNVTVQVMPLDSTPHPGIVGGFSLVSFPGSIPDVVLVENLGGDIYLEGDATSPFTTAAQRISAAALSVEDSLVRITQLKEGHRK
ncbi:helix-turn-helix domain-containing protein [Streptomyces hainanensis]|uniref:XRE family transcriptional regulator n=1 Tax=Streptomyces hainanensis TaxID=402648 RepID=A0A4R4U0B1_9ACTN|nr:helix-turn-helix transcriptional regulator [Streptomyces hainanensis]TDC79959.1 XRE family transcriptional regulator [Streptomyces hainanensis]